MTLGVLRGREHAGVGRIASIGEDRVAVVLSRGGAAKTYAHKDPNEDAVGFARGPAGCVLVAADAHAGCEAGETAVERVLEAHAGGWITERPPGPAWAERAAAAVADAHLAVMGLVTRGASGRSRTTLAFALVRSDEQRVYWASIGDSHVFLARPEQAEEVAAGSEQPSYFVGAGQRTPEELTPRIRLGEASTRDLLAVCLATDGLSEPGIGVADPAAALADAVRASPGAVPDLRALSTARALVDQALAAHRRHRAGDNIAAAVCWVAP